MTGQILYLKPKISRDGQIYEHFTKERQKAAREESFVARDMVVFRGATTYVSFYPTATENRIPVVKNEFFDSLKPGTELLITINGIYNGANQEIGVVDYTDMVFRDGSPWAVIVLRNKLHALPMMGTEIFKLLGDNEELISEKATESHLKIEKKFGPGHSVFTAS